MSDTHQPATIGVDNLVPFDDSPTKRNRPAVIQQVRRSHTPLKGGLAKMAQQTENAGLPLLFVLQSTGYYLMVENGKATQENPGLPAPRRSHTPSRAPSRKSTCRSDQPLGVPFLVSLDSVHNDSPNKRRKVEDSTDPAVLSRAGSALRRSHTPLRAPSRGRVDRVMPVLTEVAPHRGSPTRAPKINVSGATGDLSAAPPRRSHTPLRAASRGRVVPTHQP